MRAAYSSGTPAIGVGAGNVAVIVDETADVADAAAKIARSKTFDNATSCSSENSVIAVAAVADALARRARTRGRRAARRRGDATAARARCSRDGKLAPEVVAQSAPAIAARGGLVRPELERARFLIVEETGVGAAHPFSGEKLSPVLAFYRVADFAAAAELAERLLALPGRRATRSGCTRASPSGRSSSGSRFPCAA